MPRVEKSVLLFSRTLAILVESFIRYSVFCPSVSPMKIVTQLSLSFDAGLLLAAIRRLAVIKGNVGVEDGMASNRRPVSPLLLAPFFPFLRAQRSVSVHPRAN